MVLESDSAEQVLVSAAHEWVHQYLIFYPLGEGYWNSQETREINETTAELVGTEVGGQVAARLGLTAAPVATTTPAPRTRPAFDFRAFMRETRAHVEELLAAQRVDDAEAYMRARRDELQQHGYYIRKLNQAYFALYGSYGEGFAASPANPIPGYLRTLRTASPTLADFLVRVRDITTVAQLREAADRASQTDLPA
jgi:predicted aminopeptidase